MNPSPSERQDVLLLHQRRKMAQSAHAYVRGSTSHFYKWLESDAVRGTLPKGPSVWICGDCHVGNIGPIADTDGNVDIQIRDLDQSVIGNPSHDILRLGLSLAMAARSSDLPGVTTALLLEELMSAYIGSLSGDRDSIDTVRVEPIKSVLRQSKSRKWKHLAEERIQDVKPKIPLGKAFWALSDVEQDALTKLFETDVIRELILKMSRGASDEPVELVDSAYWRKGCSSLGRVRYALLIKIGNGNHAEHRLLDVKQAVKPLAPHDSTVEMPNNDAERVVTGARNLSPFLGQRMAAASLGNRHVVVRELRPQDMKFELDSLTADEAVQVARVLASAVGIAHGRQMSKADRRSWARSLSERHVPGVDAPRWVWNAILDLIAIHDKAYLEHCRKFVLSK